MIYKELSKLYATECQLDMRLYNMEGQKKNYSEA